MNNANDTYHSILRDVMKYGTDMPPSRGQEHGTKEVFARHMQMNFDLTYGLPVVTTKKVWLHGIIHELVWFLSGDTNIKYLIENNVNIWNGNAYDFYVKTQLREKDVVPDLDIFLNAVKDGARLSNGYTYGDLGPVYGAQWANQLPGIVEALKKNPDSRQIILNTWSTDEIKDMALPPCHSVPIHFRVVGDHLDAFMYQRSADLFLGVPFNITSTSLLLMVIGHLVGKTPRYFTHQLGSAHIYLNHIDQVTEQLSRDTNKYPSYIDCSIGPIVSIGYMNAEDFDVGTYKFHPKIKGEMVV